MFLFHGWFLSHDVWAWWSLGFQYFFSVVRNISFRTPSTKYQLQLTKRRSKVQEKNISCALEFRIDGTPCLLIIPFFATLPNLIQHSPFINFGEFCQPPLLFQTPLLLIYAVDSGSMRPRQSHKTVWCTCFFISMTFISIYRLRFGDFLSIC